MSLTRSFVEENIKKVDSLDGLDLFCYAASDKPTEKCIQQCRGIVFDQESLILQSFPFTPEYVPDDLVFLETEYPDISQFVFFQSFEGTLLRVFCHAEKWYLSTHRRLDAFKSRWASKLSFGELFVLALQSHSDMELLENFFQSLDPTRQYMFLLQNNQDNRLVCDAPDSPRIYHVGTLCQGQLDWEHTLPSFPYPPKLSFTAWTEVVDYVSNTDIRECQGIIAYHGLEQFKVLHPHYKYLQSLRGNEVSIPTRYLHLRRTEKISDFTSLYPSFQPVFDMYEEALFRIASQIFDAYIQRFIHKQHVVLYPEEYQVLKACHGWHIEDRRRHRVTFEKVQEVLDTQAHYKLNKMIRRHLRVQKIRDNANSVLRTEPPNETS